MDGVWEAIEEAQVPVSHHIGERPPARRTSSTPSASDAPLRAPFRDMFGKYVFGGILDRHQGLRVGWFEGGINWVPSAIQDAEHMASFLHTRQPENGAEPAYYWDNHMYAAFMVDPLGLDLIDRIGVTRSCGRPTSRTTRARSATATNPTGRRGGAIRNPQPV